MGLTKFYKSGSYSSDFRVAVKKKVHEINPPLFSIFSCSKTHLPGYVEQADDLKSKGIKEIFCISVNDPFVMAAWGENQKAEGMYNLHLHCTYTHYVL